MGTRYNRLNEAVLTCTHNICFELEAVLTCTHNICFEQKYEKSKKKSTETCYFYSREKSLYIAWTCFRNA